MFQRKRLLLLFVSLALVIVPLAPVVAQDDVAHVEVWVAFSDDRLDWTQEKAAEFNAMFPQYEVEVIGGMSYEEMFAQVAVAGEQGDLPAVIHFFEAGTQDARDSGLFPIRRRWATAPGSMVGIS